MTAIDMCTNHYDMQFDTEKRTLWWRVFVKQHTNEIDNKK